MYITGDCHGDFISHFSKKKHPCMRDAKVAETIVICGDCGVPFGTQNPLYKNNGFKYDKNQLDWMYNNDCCFLCIGGNHEDYDFIESLPKVSRYGGTVRYMRFDGKDYYNVFYVDKPQVLDIEGNHCLIIPGADSHDVSDGILDPNDKDFKSKYVSYKKNNKEFRIKHWNWWPKEKVDIDAVSYLLEQHEDEHFDFVFTHDCPGIFNELGLLGGPRLVNTESENYFETLRQALDFDKWFFGHMHTNQMIPIDERCVNLYNSIVRYEKEGE